MKQILLLEASDLAALKSGRTIELTKNMMLSLGVKFKPEREEKDKPLSNYMKRKLASQNGGPVTATVQPDRKALVHNTPGKYSCEKCGKSYTTPQGLGPHRRSCPRK